MIYLIILGVFLLLLVGFFALAAKAKKAMDNIDSHYTSMASLAVKRAKERFQTLLDYTPESIEKVEEILDRIYRQNLDSPFGKHRLEVECDTWGGYIGEVIKRVRPGKWMFTSKESGPGSRPFVYSDGSGESFPLSWIHKRLTKGVEESVAEKFKLTVLQHEEHIKNVVTDETD